MDSTTVSSKFQVVIPKRVREELALQPGQKLQVVHYEGRIELIPIESIANAKGFLEGINTKVARETDRL